MNAPNGRLIDEIGATLDGFEADPNTGGMAITGADKAFALTDQKDGMAAFAEKPKPVLRDA